MVFDVGLSNWKSAGREFLNTAKKLLVVDFVDWWQNSMSMEGNGLRLKRKARSKMSVHPHFVAV